PSRSRNTVTNKVPSVALRVMAWKSQRLDRRSPKSQSGASLAAGARPAAPHAREVLCDKRRYMQLTNLWVGFVGLVGSLGIGPPVALAQATDPRAIEKAKERFERGQRLYTISRYREALDEFKEAYLLKQDPALLYNIAQCHRLLGEAHEAITFYRR